MSEPLGATRVKAPVKLARSWAPHPPPLVPRRPAMPSEIPLAASRFLRTAMAAQWHAVAFYALGWGVDTSGVVTGKLKASVLVRGRRGEERFTALWSTAWPVPGGVVIPELPPLALPRDGHVNVLHVLLAGQEQPRPAAATVTVKWAYDLGAYWWRGSPPLAGGPGWQGYRELLEKIRGGPA